MVFKKTLVSWCPFGQTLGSPTKMASRERAANSKSPAGRANLSHQTTAITSGVLVLWGKSTGNPLKLDLMIFPTMDFPNITNPLNFMVFNG